MPNAPRWRRILLLLTAMLCTAVLCIAVMQVSMSRGRLAFNPQWDDVMYMSRGAELTKAGREGWVADGVSGAVRGVTREWKQDPPHSPWATGAAATGFAVFGYRDWAAYVPTALPVLAFILCAARLARRAGGRLGWRAHALVVFAATAPFLAASVHNLKPDYAAGICTAIAMMKLLRGPLLAASRRALIWAGVWFGLALLVKPAMMVPTGMLAVGTLGICTLRDIALQRGPGMSVAIAARSLLRAWRPCVLVLGVMVLVAAPHYAFALRSEWEYTRSTLSGEGIERWGYRGTWFQHATYYLTGPGGRLMFDGARSLVPLGVALVVYGCVVLRPRSGRRRKLYFASILAAIAMAWAGPTLSTVKISQFASCFTALLWLAGVHSAAGICAAARQWGGGMVDARPTGWLRRAQVASIVVLALVVGRLSVERWALPLAPADRNDPARAARRGYEAISSENRVARVSIDGDARKTPQTLLVAGGQLDLVYLFTLWGIRDDLSLDVRGVDHEPAGSDPAQIERAGRAFLDGSDLVLVSQGVAKGNKPRVVSADEFYLGLARTDPRFELAARVTGAAPGAVIEVYRRRVGS
jgi:hypothetical protein